MILERPWPGTSTVAAARTCPTSPRESIPRCEAGSTTTEPSTAPCCTPWQRASTSTSCDGPCRNSNDCAADQPGHGDGWTPFDGASPPYSRTGTCCHPPHAGLWEPYDGRPSRTVLRGREGEAPSRYSPGVRVAPCRGGVAELRQLVGPRGSGIEPALPVTVGDLPGGGEPHARIADAVGGRAERVAELEVEGVVGEEAVGAAGDVGDGDRFPPVAVMSGWSGSQTPCSPSGTRTGIRTRACGPAVGSAAGMTSSQLPPVARSVAKVSHQLSAGSAESGCGRGPARRRRGRRWSTGWSTRCGGRTTAPGRVPRHEAGGRVPLDVVEHDRVAGRRVVDLVGVGGVPGPEGVVGAPQDRAAVTGDQRDPGAPVRLPGEQRAAGEGLAEVEEQGATTSTR